MPRENAQIKHTRDIAFILCGAFFILVAFNLINLATSGLRLKQSITQSASAGFENIISGALAVKDSRFETAKELFNAAQDTFKNIQADTWFTAPQIPTLTLQDPTFQSANAIISAGQSFAQAGAKFAQVAQALQNLPKSFFESNDKKIIGEKPSLTEKLKAQMPAINEAALSLANANQEIQKVPESFVPKVLREKFKFAKDALFTLSEITENLNSDMPAILEMLGDTKPHTYLVLLQNNAEIRPSGGFIGNYIILETNDGYLTKNEVFDVYSADHQLNENIAPPIEILPVNNRWFLRDSNYSGDFPLSAAKAAWFLEKENGPGVDSIVAIDQTFVAELLRLTGSVKIPQLNQPLTAENFSTIISYFVEAKIAGRENPKEILKNFMQVFQKALFERVDPIELLPFLQAAIESKHLLAYSKNETVQNFFQRRSMSGKMKTLEPKEDYLNIVHTNIGGNKSDSYMTETIAHDTYLKSDGAVIDEITITRTHQWNNEIEKSLHGLVSSFGFPEITKNVIEILGRSRNLHYLRIYVPAGSTLIESSDPSLGAQFDAETGKTYFSVKMEVGVKDSRNLMLRYQLPFKLNLNPVDKYTLSVQKQPGQENTIIQKRIFPDSRVMNYKYFPENGAFDPDGIWSFETQLNKDLSFTSVWGK